MDMIPVYTLKSESEAAVITSLMTAYEIDFLISGKNFSSMYPGAVSTGLNEQTLMVKAEQAELAKELLAPFLKA
ncbi:MAG: hypothetical protein GX070_07525 [Alcaligenaceae bacterium]|nr:hypothetical protein [Alcaligenaceae bacterium]NLY64787.1 hypothetical protein [Alcaligenaceae bacterium]